MTVKRIEDSALTWQVAEELIGVASARCSSMGMDGLLIAIDATFTALVSSMSGAGWTLDQAKHYIEGSLAASFGTDGTKQLDDAARTQAATKGRAPS